MLKTSVQYLEKIKQHWVDQLEIECLAMYCECCLQNELLLCVLHVPVAFHITTNLYYKIWIEKGASLS